MHISHKIALLALALLAITATIANTATAQSYRKLGTEFEAMRDVELPRELKDQKDSPKIVIVEFLHHGLIKLADPNDLSTANVAVFPKSGDAVPTRLLQLGPGDFCRLAFEPVARQANYEIYYGGAPPSPALLPKWSTNTGLLFESREYQNNDLRTLKSLRDAFDAAKPIGADYVPGVQHANNPTDVKLRPFLSRYSGKLRITKPGDYLFWTASQDCSFLVIDGKEVVSAPGQHGPQYQAKPDQAGKVKLSAGLHDFEYYHAATGIRTMMVLAWAMAPHAKDDRPTAIPPEWFESDSILRVEPGPVTTQTHRLVPDFDYKALGDVPLPDDPTPLIGVGFRNRSLPALTTNGAKLLWDFGDGQTSTETNPSHVYLRPGEYTVSLTSKRGNRNVTTTNRIQVDRPYRDHTTKEKPHKLDEYLPLLTQYDLTKLDTLSALQLAQAYQWKAQGGDKEQKAENAEQEPEGKEQKTENDNMAAQAWLARAVDVGLANLKATDKPETSQQEISSNDTATLQLAQLTGDIARFDLGKPHDAFTIYRIAAQQRPPKIHNRKVRADCAIHAADIAINELLDRRAAQSLLEKAENDLGLKDLVQQIDSGDTLKIPPTKPDMFNKHFFRVLGDYAASLGKGESAVKAYQAASQTSQSLTHTRDTARRGAYSRSTEQFLKDNELDRAAREITAWCDQYPDEKIDGYFTLLYARLLFARDQFEQAIAQCDQLTTVNPESPYLDRLLLIASESQRRLGHPDRAAALLHELIDAHPGSPLVPEAKRRLQ